MYDTIPNLQHLGNFELLNALKHSSEIETFTNDGRTLLNLDEYVINLIRNRLSTYTIKWCPKQV